MKISARNILRGKIVDVRKDAVAAQIQVDVGGGHVITATITSDSAERLTLAKGKEVSVVIKASDVMLAVDD
jgi:molybdopterin-binding protein